MSKSVCLETRELKFSYPDGPTALHGISLDVKRGDFVAVIGQNGSGKTTLAKHFNGLLRPDAGKVC
ncbi:MAG: ATP-binding cassette domain-containing protein, partial [Anaerolineales bacterium]|nr:ATP-binding cassette domain-containing protein [Anaerolineales bacterium]